MEERSDSPTEKVLYEEVMLPGFRFHPTDEELVGFYLKRKVQQRPLSIELIKQLDIYKYDPWDLPKLASTAGEKEWYFYCPRDRKYRNSARPNRVTGAGFWKATGTDRPIYSSEGTKCIGLKKSLVFYKGRAAKGVKTDWMMHEFRLPSLVDHSLPSKRSLDKSFPANDSWAICRIFKKTNSTAQRALSHSWFSPLPEPINTSTDQYMLSDGKTSSCQFSSETSNVSLMSTTNKTTSSSSPPIQFCSTTNDNIQDSSTNSTSLSPIDFSSLYKAYHNISSADFCPSLLFPPLESSTTTIPGPAKCALMDNISPNAMFLNMSSMLNLGDSHFGCDKSLISETSQNHVEQHGNNNGFEIALPYHHDPVFQGSNNLGNISSTFDHQSSMVKNLISVNEGTTSDHDHHISDQDQWEAVRSSLGFPVIGATLPLPALPLNTSMADPWKPSLLWDTSQCPTQVMSTNFPTSTRCFT